MLLTSHITPRLCCSMLALSLLGSGAAADELTGGAGDPYAEGMAKARAADARGDLAGESLLLVALLPLYPQDVELPLQLAWTLFRMGRFADAEPHYRVALERSGEGSEAELGLGFTLSKLGRCAEGRLHFEAVLAKNSAHRGAADGLRACMAKLAAPAQAQEPSAEAAPALLPSPPGLPAPLPSPLPSPLQEQKPAKVWVRPQLTQAIYVYQNNPLLRYVLASMARLELIAASHFYLAGSYRYSYFFPQPNQAAPWSQHEAYADIGYTSRPAAVLLHYALAYDGSGYYGTSHHAGLTARWSPPLGGEGVLKFSSSFYSDATVLRGELAWRFPIIGGLSLRPAGALQWTGSELLKNVALTLSYDHRRASLWVGGKYGDEQRAAYLDLAFIYNTPARIPWGVWSGLAVRPGAGFQLLLTYATDHLTRTDVTPVQDSTVHYISFSLAKDF